MHISLHQHSHASFDSTARPKDIIKKAADFGMPAIAITDHGNLGSCAEFYQLANKAGIKPLLGIELYIPNQHSTIQTSENRSCSHLVTIAKNLRGWKTLLKIIQRCNSIGYYYKPRISLEEIGELNTSHDLIAITGHPGSTLSNALWLNEGAAFNANSYEEARSCADAENWFERLAQCDGRHIDAFGKENVFIEIQRMDEDRLFMAQVLNKALRGYAERARRRKVATNDAHYVNKEDVKQQRILLSGRMKTTLGRVREKLANEEDVGMGGFFKSDNYYMLAPHEMRALHTEEELRATFDISDMCEKYAIEGAAQCPRFPDAPEGKTNSEYLHELCLEGYNKIYVPKGVDDTIYLPRLEKELEVFKKGKIEDYFLITRDILQSLRKRNKLHGPCRGSVGGSLAASCLGITINIDPIKYNLLFERFIDENRIYKGEYPDIDIDVPQDERQNVINYITEKYGSDYVAQVATFGNYKGKSALKLVLKAMDVPFALQNEITQYIPDEQKITDDLVEFAEDHEGQKSILLMILDEEYRKTNKKLIDAKNLDRYVRIKDGVLTGDFAEHFELAARMEYVQSHMGKHAAAVLIGAVPLVEKVPLVKESNGSNLIAGWSFPQCEWAGILKWDILGLAALDCLQIIAKRLHKRGKL